MFEIAGDIGQYLDQVGDVTPGVIDVSLKQDDISRGLVQLDVELTHE